MAVKKADQHVSPGFGQGVAVSVDAACHSRRPLRKLTHLASRMVPGLIAYGLTTQYEPKNRHRPVER